MLLIPISIAFLFPRYRTEGHGGQLPEMAPCCWGCSACIRGFLMEIKACLTFGSISGQDLNSPQCRQHLQPRIRRGCTAFCRSRSLFISTTAPAVVRLSDCRR